MEGKKDIIVIVGTHLVPDKAPTDSADIGRGQISKVRSLLMVVSSHSLQ